MNRKESLKRCRSFLKCNSLLSICRFEKRHEINFTIFGFSTLNRKSCQLQQTTKQTDFSPSCKIHYELKKQKNALPCDDPGTERSFSFRNHFLRSNRRWKLFGLRCLGHFLARWPQVHGWEQVEKEKKKKNKLLSANNRANPTGFVRILSICLATADAPTGTSAHC